MKFCYYCGTRVNDSTTKNSKDYKVRNNYDYTVHGSTVMCRICWRKDHEDR